MKNLALLSILLTGQIAIAQIDRKGNGGDDVKIDIATVQNIILTRSGDWTTFQKKNVSVDLLKEKVRIVSAKLDGIEIKDTVSLEDGIPRSAVNYPDENKIVVSRTFWTAIGEDKIRKIGILLHEYLGLMGLEKTDDYAISSFVANELLTNRSLIEVNALPTRSSVIGKWSMTSWECSNAKDLPELTKTANIDIGETDVKIDMAGKITRGSFWILQGNNLSIQFNSKFETLRIEQKSEKNLSWIVDDLEAQETCGASAKLILNFQKNFPGPLPIIKSYIDGDGVLRRKDGSTYYMHRCEAMGQNVGCYLKREGGYSPGCPAGTHLPTRLEMQALLSSKESILKKERYWWTSTDYLPGSHDSLGYNYYYSEFGEIIYRGPEKILGTYLDTVAWGNRFFPGIIDGSNRIDGENNAKLAVMCITNQPVLNFGVVN